MVRTSRAPARFRLSAALLADAWLDDERRGRLSDTAGRVEELGGRDPAARGVDDRGGADPDPGHRSAHASDER
jgi:hypothetical protein